MDETTETMTISNRSDFALWAIERAKAIVAEEGGNLAIATRDKGDDEVAASANALGQANLFLEVGAAIDFKRHLHIAVECIEQPLATLLAVVVGADHQTSAITMRSIGRCPALSWASSRSGAGAGASRPLPPGSPAR